MWMIDWERWRWGGVEIENGLVGARLAGRLVGEEWMVQWANGRADGRVDGRSVETSGWAGGGVPQLVVGWKFAW